METQHSQKRKREKERIDDDASKPKGIWLRPFTSLGMCSLDWRVEAPGDSAPTPLLEGAVLLAGGLGVDGGVDMGPTLRTNPKSPLFLRWARLASPENVVLFAIKPT